MSGDVQPRKRKDKRRRRDEDEAGLPVFSARNGSSDHLDNVTIHVHKENSTGGHWCAKIIFFALLVALLSVVGIIILEHRGSTEVDTPSKSHSQWAMIFEGWVDDTSATHEEESDAQNSIEEFHEHGDQDEGDHEQDEEVNEQERGEDEHEPGDQTSPEDQADGEENQLEEEEEQEQEDQDRDEGEGEETEGKEDEEEEKQEQDGKEEEEDERLGPGGIAEIDDYNEDADADADTDPDDGYFNSREEVDDGIEPQEDKTLSEEDLHENQSKEEENDYYVERSFDYASTEKGA